jgi:hypothetical protein
MEADTQMANEIAAGLAAMIASAKGSFEYRAHSRGKFAGHKRTSTNPNLRWIGHEVRRGQACEGAAYRATPAGLADAEPLIVTLPWRKGQTRRMAYMGDASECWSETR